MRSRETISRLKNTTLSRSQDVALYQTKGLGGRSASIDISPSKELVPISEERFTPLTNQELQNIKVSVTTDEREISLFERYHIRERTDKVMFASQIVAPFIQNATKKTTTIDPNITFQDIQLYNRKNPNDLTFQNS
jgi:hypothetical protein